jgi:histidyl-tRNA synthetase
MFSGTDVPAVGVSIGIERVFSIVEAAPRAAAAAEGGHVRDSETAVLVASVGKGLQEERMGLAADLWAAGVAAEFGYKVRSEEGGGKRGEGGGRVDRSFPFFIIVGAHNPLFFPPFPPLPFQANPNLKDQLHAADEAGIPFVALVGAEEVAAGVVKVKDMAAGTEESVPRGEVVGVLAARVAGLGERALVAGRGRGRKEEGKAKE